MWSNLNTYLVAENLCEVSPSYAASEAEAKRREEEARRRVDQERKRQVRMRKSIGKINRTVN